MTRSRLMVLTAMTLAIGASAAAAQGLQLTIRPDSKLSLAGSSNVHNWSCKSTGFLASVEVDLSQAVTGAWDANNAANAGKGVYDPSKWAVTKSNLRVGDVLASDPRFLDEISFEGKVAPGPRGKNKKPTACIVASNFDFKLHAEHQITAIERTAYPQFKQSPTAKE